MKRFESILTLLGVICWAATGYSQVKHLPNASAISAQRIILKYKKHGDSERESNSDTLRIPVAGDNYPALKKALSYPNLFLGNDLKTLRANYADCSCGITGLDYEVTFENKDVISLKLLYETEAAYPSSSETWLTLDKHMGKTHPLSSEIDRKGREWLLRSTGIHC